MEKKYTVFVRGKDGSQGTMLSDFVRLQILDTLNDFGEWSMKSVTNGVCPFTAGDGISVFRDAVYLYGGIVSTIQDTLDATTGLHEWEVTGIGDLGWLGRRICFVDPTTDNPNARAHYTDSGVLSTVIETLISKNIGVNALSSRQESIMESGSGSFGDSVSVSLRFQNLFNAVKALALSNGYNIRPVWNSTAHKLHYELFQGVNRTQQIIFTEQLENITESEYLGTVPEGNFILAGGTGEMTARQFVKVSNADSISEWGLVEAFQDGRNQDDLQTYAEQTLAEKSDDKTGYSCVASDADNAPQYITDYKLGDIVSMKINGLYIASQIQQVEITIEDGYERISPKFGTIAISKFKQLFSMITDLRQDVNELLGTEIE